MIGSLFSGIGGLELGLEWAGLGPVIWQVEKDPFCRAVLAKHWPEVPRYDDVTTVRSLPYADVVCGGFPCQDVSAAGRQAGLGGARSSLWWYFASLVGKVRPRFVVVENVASGARLWLPTVRRHLHLLGYDSTAYALSAADVGAPHLRRRVFVVAHSERESLRQFEQRGSARRARVVPNEGQAQPVVDGGEGGVAAAAHPDGPLREGEGIPSGVHAKHAGSRNDDGDADRDGEPTRSVDAEAPRMRRLAGGAWSWPPPSGIRGVDDGVSPGPHISSRYAANRGVNDGPRLRALGNAVVPQCAEVIGRIVVEMMREEA